LVGGGEGGGGGGGDEIGVTNIYVNILNYFSTNFV
jgi:hypothetical protein